VREKQDGKGRAEVMEDRADHEVGVGWHGPNDTARESIYFWRTGTAIRGHFESLNASLSS
jgi:hypothetical protein